jgi:hypothetical protein
LRVARRLNGLGAARADEVLARKRMRAEALRITAHLPPAYEFFTLI